MKTFSLLASLSLALGTTCPPGAARNVQEVSAYCLASGGRPDGPTDKNGDVACFFGRAGISSLTLLNAVALKHTTKAVEAFLNGCVEMPEYDGSYNPSYKYCQLAGGAPRELGDHVLCRFEDGSAIEAWTLLRGPKAAVNSALVERLRATSAF